MRFSRPQFNLPSSPAEGTLFKWAGSVHRILVELLQGVNSEQYWRRRNAKASTTTETVVSSNGETAITGMSLTFIKSERPIVIHACLAGVSSSALFDGTWKLKRDSTILVQGMVKGGGGSAVYCDTSLPGPYVYSMTYERNDALTHTIHDPSMFIEEIDSPGEGS